jgi:hypothetical protein
MNAPFAAESKSDAERAAKVTEIAGSCIDVTSVRPGKNVEQIGVVKYLRNRGIDPFTMPGSIKRRTRGAASRGHGALVGLCTDDAGNICGTHEINITRDGNKTKDAHGTGVEKRSHGRVQGNPVRMPACGRDKETLIVSEGIENALSIWQATSIETWASVGSGMMQYLPVPKGRTVFIFRDGDEPGSPADQNINRAIHAFQMRGANVRLATPPQGKDANDLLVEGGFKALQERLLCSVEPPFDILADAQQQQTPPEPLLFEKLFDFVPEELPARDWIIPGLLERGQAHIMPGHGGSAKSLLGIGIGMACTFLKKFGKWEPRRKLDGTPYRIAIVNLEDDVTEQQRRVAAMLQTAAFAGVDYKTFAENCLTLRRDGLTLVEKDDKGGIKTTQLYSDLVGALREFKADVVILDPLAELTLGMDENSAEMHELHAAIRRMARSLNAAVIVVHHFNKGGNATNQNSFRGSTTLGAGPRATLNVEKMNEDDAKQFGINDAERPSYIKTYIAKANYTATGVTQWFQIVPKTLPNAEQVAALEPWNPPKDDIIDMAAWPQRDAFLDAIERGEYTNARTGRTTKRADHLLNNISYGGFTLKQAQTVLDTLLAKGMLGVGTAKNKSRQDFEKLIVRNRTVFDAQPDFIGEGCNA